MCGKDNTLYILFKILHIKTRDLHSKTARLCGTELFLLLLVFVPALNLYIVDIQAAKCLNEGRCQPGIGNERDIEVDSGTTYFVAIVELLLRQVLGNIYHQIDLFVVQHFQSLRLAIAFAGPKDFYSRYTVIGEELVRTPRSKKAVSFFVQKLSSFEHIGFLLGATGRKQDILFRNLITHRKHGFQDSFARVEPYTAHFSGRSHIHTQHRVGLLQTREGELRRFNTT